MSVFFDTGPPTWAIRTSSLPRLQSATHRKVRCTLAWDCLVQCGLRDGVPAWGRFCIDQRLAAALRAEIDKGMFFRGAGALPFGKRIATVRALIEHLLTPRVAA